MRRHFRVGILALLLAGATSACGRADRGSAGVEGLPVLSIGGAPTQEIGTIEGDPNYLFERVIGTVHLPSGDLAVADQGSDRISIFGPDGSFVRHVGGRGEGPGEFRDLVRIYRTSSDSIEAADGNLVTILVFDSSGAYRRQFRAIDLSRDSLFQLDSWLHGRFWVEGALTEQERVPVRAALDALPEPVGSPGFRMLRVAVGGALWILEPEISASGSKTWAIIDPSGRPTSMIDLPGRFEPLEIREDVVTGRWLGANDVNFVRSYSVSPTTETRSPPAWLTADSTAAGAPPPTEEEFRATMRPAIQRSAMAQEIHYSTHMTYTSELDSLKWERPEGLEVFFVQSGRAGLGGGVHKPDVRSRLRARLRLRHPGGVVARKDPLRTRSRPDISGTEVRFGCPSIGDARSLSRCRHTLDHMSLHMY